MLPGVFCQVTAYGATLKDVVVIPRDALHDDLVYLARNGKLHRQKVKVAAREEELVVVSEGINAGDVVILTDLLPASENMPVRVELVPNPVAPRDTAELDIPGDLFEDVDSSPSPPDGGVSAPGQPATEEAP